MSVRLREELAASLAAEARAKGHASLNAYVNEICRQHLFERGGVSWKRETLNRKATEKKLLNLILMPGAMGKPDIISIIGSVHHVSESMIFIEYENERGLPCMHPIKLAIEDIKAWEDIEVMPVDIEKARAIQAWLEANRDANQERLKTDGANHRDWLLPTRFNEPYTPSHAAALRTLGFTYSDHRGPFSTILGANTCNPPEEYLTEEAKKRAKKAIDQGKTVQIPMLLEISETGFIRIKQKPWEEMHVEAQDNNSIAIILGFGIRSKGAGLQVHEFRIGGSPNLILDPVVVNKHSTVEVLNLRTNPILIRPNAAWLELEHDASTPPHELDLEAYLLVEPTGHSR